MPASGAAGLKNGTPGRWRRSVAVAAAGGSRWTSGASARLSATTAAGPRSDRRHQRSVARLGTTRWRSGQPTENSSVSSVRGAPSTRSL